jgi:hypothetical protein
MPRHRRRENVTTLQAQVLVLLAAWGPTGAQAGQPDACAPLIPVSLVSAIEKQYGAYRLPRESDNTPEDLAFVIPERGHGCLGVASGDFDGDGTADVALLLEARTGKHGLVLAALARKKGWRLGVVDEYEGRIRGLYLDRAPPGRYVETEAGDGSEDVPNALPSFVSAHDGLFVGLLESPARAYFRVRGRWRYVQVSD